MPFKSTKARFEEIAQKMRSQSDKTESDKTQTDTSKKFSPSVPKGKQKENFIVRILPNIFVNEGLDEPYFEFKAHMPKTASGKKGYAVCPWYFNKEAKCPLCLESRKYWDKVNKNIAGPSDEAKARNFGSKFRYITNVLVVSDPRAGDQNQTGQVLTWEYGIQVQEKLKEAFVQGVNFYDVNEGFNFNVVIKMKGDNANYEGCFFSRESTPISTKSEELERIHSQIVDIKSIIKEKIATTDKLTSLLTGGGSKPKENQNEQSERPVEGKTYASEPTMEKDEPEGIADVIEQTDADNSHTVEDPEGIDFTNIDDLFDDAK
jgi:hypothetical protein